MIRRAFSITIRENHREASLPEESEANDAVDGYPLELEPYLSDHISRGMFDSLKWIYDPLEFFKLFHKLLKLVRTGNSLLAVNEIDTLDL